MNIQWHNIAAIIATMLLLGGVMIAIMKRFFVSTERCAVTHKDHRIDICKKIDELKSEIKEDRKTANTHYAEVKETLGLIQGKLESF